MKKLTSSLDSDIISHLPGNITDIILTSLPLRDAVRTSTLSKKWRYCWINLPKLVFDETMYQLQIFWHHTRYKVISIISQVLLLHQGPLLEFSLSHSSLESCPEIDMLISFLSKKRVEVFSLNTCSGKIHEKYKLPSSFFACRELTHLNLAFCVFTPPYAFYGFRRLISLSFVNVDISTDLFGSFISSCPQLERLTLINPSRFLCFKTSVPSLKYLHVEGSREQIVISEFENYLPLKDGEECRLVRFFQVFPAVNTLVTTAPLLERLVEGSLPEKLPTFINLKFLKLSGISFTPIQMSSIFLMISSLSLQRIEIEAIPPLYIPRSLQTIDCNADIEYNLREVRLISISGRMPELELIKVLLARSPVLKTMLIKPALDDVASRLELLTKLTRFQRSSRMAEIIYAYDAPYDVAANVAEHDPGYDAYDDDPGYDAYAAAANVAEHDPGYDAYDAAPYDAAANVAEHDPGYDAYDDAAYVAEHDLGYDAPAYDAPYDASANVAEHDPGYDAYVAEHDPGYDAYDPDLIMYRYRRHR